MAEKRLVACTMSPQFSDEDIAEEQAHFSNVVATFRQYVQYSVNRPSSKESRRTDPRSQLTANNRRRKDLYKLPHADKGLLDAIGYRHKLQEIDAAILANAEFLHKIVANPEIFGHDVDVVVGEDGAVEESERSFQRASGPYERGETIQMCSSFFGLCLWSAIFVFRRR